MDAEFARLSRRLKRETAARLEAEAIAERGLRDLYQRQQEIALLEAIAVAANEAKTIDSAMYLVISMVCEYSQWPVGHGFYVPEGRNAKQGQLESTKIWYCKESERFDEFRQATADIEFNWGVGLPGRVWSTASPAWIDNISQDNNFPRQEPAQRASLRAAYAFPVLVDADVVAVLEFFGNDIAPLDSTLQRILIQIGTQLGRVLERQRAKDRLIHDALHDSLTQLPNRTLFLDRLQNQLNRVKRQPTYGFAVLFLDLDRFKAVNDSLGHAAGDQLLLQVAHRLTHCLRDTDVVSRIAEGEVRGGGAHVLARLGGDEFTIIVENVREVSESIRIVERMQRALSQPFLLGEQQVYTTASIGITLSSGGYEAVADMLRDADIAMYRAKELGSARWIVFNKAMHEQAVQTLQLENDLRQALDNQQFFLCYQPIVSLPDTKICGFEALIRWNHPTRGLVSPLEFISRAEVIGLIRPIGSWVLDAACKQAKRWQDAFPMNPPLTMSVNLSVGQLGQSDLLEVFSRIVHDSRIAPGSLKLELTESVVMNDADKTCELLIGLRKLGIQMSLDDFGTGYSSLSYLRRLPIDALKIDRSFVRDMDSNEEKREIAHFIVMLARALGLKVIAEGTETLAEVESLNRMGCDYAQGYYFFKPLESEMAEQALKLGYGHLALSELPHASMPLS